MSRSEQPQGVVGETDAPKRWTRNIWQASKKGFLLTRNVWVAWGLLSLIAIPGQWVYRAVSLNDAVAIVVPICERYVFGPNDDIVVSLEKDYRYIGANIYAFKPTLNARVRFTDVFSVSEWGMYSDALSDEEIQTYLSQLPTDITPSEFVTPPLPDLAAETETSLVMLGRALIDEDCRELHVEMSAIPGEIYHAREDIRMLREFPSLLFHPLWLVALVYLLPIAVWILVRVVPRLTETGHVKT